MSCCCSGVGAAAERQFGEKRATADLAQYRTKGPGSTARLLLAGIAKAGQPHERLLVIGSGVGALTFELLERGLMEAIGVDLSAVEHVIRRAGFELVSRSCTRTWCADVYGTSDRDGHVGQRRG